MKKPNCLNLACSLHGNVESSHIIRYGFYRTTAGKRRRYRCVGCGQTFSTTKGTPYYRLQHRRTTFDTVVTLRVEGVSLSAIARVERLAWNTVARWLERAAAVCRPAVGAAHGQGLVHRDLKPENIFLVGNQPGAVTKVLDFGLAKALGGTTSTADTLHTRDGVLLGTIPYMSPERLRGGAVDEAWDLWALGVVAFEILRGELPFTGVNAAALDATSAESHTASLRARLSDAPDRSQEFFACALSLDTHKRPASAEQFFAQLREAISG